MGAKTTFSQTLVSPVLQKSAEDIIRDQERVAARPYSPYTGPTIAGFNTDQNTGFGATRDAAFGYKPALEQATAATNTALGRSSASAIAPWLGQITDTSGQQGALRGLDTASGLNTASTDALGIRMAQPWLDKAGGSAVDDIDTYMNPFMDKVLQQFAERGQRNLQEVLIPGATNKFIGAGQLGGGPARGGGAGAPSGLMTESARALRDTQEAVLKQQAEMQMGGWKDALAASQADKARFGTLAGTAGQLGLGQQEVLGRAAGNEASIAGQRSNIDFGNRNLVKDAASLFGTAYGQDTSNMFTGAGQLAGLADQSQRQGLAGAGALVGIGNQQQALEQANLDEARRQREAQQGHDQAMIDARARTMAGASAGFPQGQIGYEGSKAPSAGVLQTLLGAGATAAGLAGGFK